MFATFLSPHEDYLSRLLVPFPALLIPSLPLSSFLKIEFFTICVSVRLSDRSLHREEQKQFVKNCPQWGLKAGPPDLQANALPTELSQHSVANLNLHGLFRVMLYWFKKWTKSNMWSGAWNKQSSLQKSPAQQIPASSVGKALAEVLVSIPTGGNFWQKYFFSSLCKDLSDNLTEMRIVKNSNEKIKFSEWTLVLVDIPTLNKKGSAWRIWIWHGIFLQPSTHLKRILIGNLEVEFN